MKKMIQRSAVSAAAIMLILFIIFNVIYRYDNKYTKDRPVGENGVLVLEEEDIEEPVFLIDGWMLSVDGAEPVETFIGEYSNFSFVPGGTSPFGKGRYELNIKYNGEPQVVTLELPEIFTEYEVMVDGKKIAETKSGTAVSFMMHEDTGIVIETENKNHYYSGIYYPLALGKTEDIARIQFIRNFFYGFICIGSFTLSIASVVLWGRKGENRLFRHFGLICMAFTVSCLHPYTWQFGLNCPLTYALEDGARLILCVNALVVSAEAAGIWERIKKLYPILTAFAILLGASLVFIVPNAASFIPVYGVLVEIFSLICWFGLAVCTGIGLISERPYGSVFSLAGCCILGDALLANVIDNNYFEPIYTGWQGEWGGFILVIVFGIQAIFYNRAIISENNELTKHLDEMVAHKTAQLEAIIDERKNFFSDMAHNLKAPIAAIQGFITLVRGNRLGLDDELLGYISLIEDENAEMKKRVNALNEINAFDRIDQPYENISVNSLLDKVREYNEPETEAVGLFFNIGKLDEDVQIYAQEEKLLIMFENMIYNSISFTEPGGTIEIIPETDRNNNELIIKIKDTGKGIPEDMIPSIFDRFFVGRDNKNEGSGLGLYIVKLTVEELEGNISVNSEIGKGTEFTIRIPISLVKKPV